VGIYKFFFTGVEPKVHQMAGGKSHLTLYLKILVGGVGIGRLDGVLPAAAFFAICQNVKINCEVSNTQLY